MDLILSRTDEEKFGTLSKMKLNAIFVAMFKINKDLHCI